MATFKIVKKIADIPDENHYVIVTLTSQYIGNDGYEDDVTIHYPILRVTTSRDDWNKAIQGMILDGKKIGIDFVAYNVPTLAKVEQTITVSID